ncbi:Flp family type IVb pilin [Rhizobium sp. AN80A]|uniref:Flp family type IVb pilin n=1 Tax=Rhizobium sp. AN80A TaxID=3040673 RepID=UPI0024B3264E|nr:Flp family type IVb pilin [Rhizobium sp. AN80A]
MTKLVSRFLKDESGATAIEYGLIAALISVALITGASTLGSKLNTMFSNLGNTISSKTPT